MVTTLTIILAALIAVNVWLMISSAKREKQRRKLLQERMEEFDKATESHIAELQGARHRVNEAIAEAANLKKLYERLRAECEDLKLNCQRARKERDDVKAKYGALLQKRDELLAEIERLKEGPVDGGEPTVHDQPGEPAGKPLPDFKVDFDELRKSYEELAKSYESVSQKWENPSKTYLVNHIIKAYRVKNQTALANALGVSKSAISRMIK